MMRCGGGSGLTGKGFDVTSRGFHDQLAEDPYGKTKVASAWLTLQAIGRLAAWAGIGLVLLSYHEEGGLQTDYLAAPTLHACDRNILRISCHHHGANVKKAMMANSAL
jgi:hypothetical protein